VGAHGGDLEVEDQIQRHVVETGLGRGLDGVRRGLRSVDAPQEFEPPRVERLGADRDPRDTPLPPATEPLESGVAGIQLERPFETLAPRRDPEDEVRGALETVGAQERRRAAAPVEGRQTRAGELARCAQERDLAREAVEPDRLATVVVPEVVEVAIGALAGAEGNVNVDVERAGDRSPSFLIVWEKSVVRRSGRASRR
jgi:hypothetical protein